MRRFRLHVFCLVKFKTFSTCSGSPIPFKQGMLNIFHLEKKKNQEIKSLLPHTQLPGSCDTQLDASTVLLMFLFWYFNVSGLELSVPNLQNFFFFIFFPCFHYPAMKK